MHFLYILFSKSLNRFYVGESENVEQRIEWHNQHYFKSGSTLIASDWEMKLKLSLTSRSDARIVERYIKSMKSSKFLLKLIEDPLFRENFKAIMKQRFQITIS